MRASPAILDADSPRLVLDPRKLVVGKGLLPANLEEGKEKLLTILNVAYAQVLPDKEENYGLWQMVQGRIESTLRSIYQANGITAPPWNEAALMARVLYAAPSRDPNSHVALVRALLTNFQETFGDHIKYRMNHGGNVHLSFCGPTGMGKSSCAISVADWINPIDPIRLTQHVSFDLSDLPSKLKGKRPGDTVMQDEFVQLAGEGAHTFQSFFENLDDTLRASGVNLFVLSPRRQEHGSMQAELELILWNPEQKFSVFLVWLEGQPHGVIAIPWARKALWDIYTPWKQANVERSLSGQFKDNRFLTKSCLSLLSDQRFVKFMADAVNKPKMRDFRTAIELFPGSMASGGQADRMAAFMHDLCYNYERLAPVFEEWFGVKANDGLETVARKCYQE